ncbi:hypothetical protein AB4Z52_35015 [Rhizobium sp. 2YAF20]|uniref:hypothetical protein n=1 Tax=Rhizobium sp. 2YAF20 TaxID=3233027 RepID=UPI003F948A6B
MTVTLRCVINYCNAANASPLVSQRSRIFHCPDLSAELASVGYRDAVSPLPQGRGDEFRRGAPRPDPRGMPKGSRPRDVVDPYLHLDAIKVETRDFK